MRELLMDFLQNLRRVFRSVISLPRVVYFLFYYFNYLRNPKSSSFPKNRSIAYRTNGESLNMAHAIGKRWYRDFQPDFSSKLGLLKLSEQNFIQAKKSMRDLGFWIAPNQIEVNKLDSFYSAAIKNLSLLKNVSIDESEIENVSAKWNQDMINLDTQWVIEQELT